MLKFTILVENAKGDELYCKQLASFNGVAPNFSLEEAVESIYKNVCPDCDGEGTRIITAGEDAREVICECSLPEDKTPEHDYQLGERYETKTFKTTTVAN